MNEAEIHRTIRRLEAENDYLRGLVEILAEHADKTDFALSTTAREALLAHVTRNHRNSEAKCSPGDGA